MRRVLGSGVPVLFLVGALVAGCSLEHESDAKPEAAAQSSVAPSGELRLADTVDPQLFGTGDGLVLVASRLTDDGPYGGVVTSSYDGSGWTSGESLSTDGARTSGARVVINPSGVGVALWTEASGEEPDSEEPTSPPVVARVRQADGTWTEAETLGAMAYLEDVQVNARGDVAVLGYPDEGVRVLALRPAGEDWNVTDLSSYDAGSMALDEDGGVHLATTGTNRGGGGPVQVSYLPAGGTWTAPMPVPLDDIATEAAQIVALPGGGEALLVGTISATWQSTFDTQYYWATEYHLLRRGGTTGDFTERWSHDGATDMRVVADGKGVRLTWIQDEAGQQVEGAAGPTTVPTRQALLTRGPDGAVVRLGEAPVEMSDSEIGGGLSFLTASGCDGPAVIWRTHDEQERPGHLQVRVGDREATVPDEGARPVVDLQAALACTGGVPWLARSADLEQVGSDDGGDLRIARGTVVAGPLD